MEAKFAAAPAALTTVDAFDPGGMLAGLEGIRKEVLIKHLKGIAEQKGLTTETFAPSGSLVGLTLDVSAAPCKIGTTVHVLDPIATAGSVRGKSFGITGTTVALIGYTMRGL